MRRRRGGTKTPRSVSVSASPSTRMRPWSGRISPATMLISVVLPAPERPKRAVRPAPLSNAASSTKAPRRWVSATLSMRSEAKRPAGRALDQRFRSKQRRQRDRDRHKRQAERPKVAARHLDQRVDECRQGLRFARDVRDEGDRRAEFPERAGEGEDHAGEDAGQDQ